MVLKCCCNLFNVENFYNKYKIICVCVCVCMFAEYGKRNEMTRRSYYIMFIV